MLIIPWVCYLFAEIISISGIVSIMFCGIAMAHYAVENITAEARENIKDIYHAVSSNCESLAFIFIGVAVFGFQHNLRYPLLTSSIGYDTIILNFFVMLFARYCSIYGISYILSFWKSTKVSPTFQFVMWFAGFRGAMGIFCSNSLRNRDPNIFHVSRRRRRLRATYFGGDLLMYHGMHTFTQIFGFGSLLQIVIDKCDVSAKTEVEADFNPNLLGDAIKLWFIKKDETLFKKYVLRSDSEQPKPAAVPNLEQEFLDRNENKLEKNIDFVRFTNRNNLKTQPEEENDEGSEFELQEDVAAAPKQPKHAHTGSISSRFEEDNLKKLRPAVIEEHAEDEEH